MNLLCVLRELCVENVLSHAELAEHAEKDADS